MVPRMLLLLLFISAATHAAPFTHPGLLHTTRDLRRMTKSVAAGLEPWTKAYGVLTTNKHASLDYKPNAVAVVVRGASARVPKLAENYSRLYNDAAAAYALALRWHVSGDDAYADAAVRILNAWGSTLKEIDGTSDKYLASGLYGYQLANAAELVRGYAKWPATEFAVFCDMMTTVFYTMNHAFLKTHNGAKIDHYWANWDLANMASMIAIGILTDREDMFQEAVEYFKHGDGNGAVAKAVWTIYGDGTGQVQESGRDQGHATLVVALLGAICQMAYNQEQDLFAYDDNRVLAGAEYVAKYNLGLDVNFTMYKNSDVTHRQVSLQERGAVRPAWEVLYNHYVRLKKLDAPHVTAWANKVRPEGGGGDYGSTSGGFDQLGYGTLTFTRWSPNPVTAVRMLVQLTARSRKAESGGGET
jgi:hypothetical protein